MITRRIRELIRGPAVLVKRINEIIAAVNTLNNMTGDGYIQVKKTARGVGIQLSVDRLLPRIPRMSGNGISINIKWFKLSVVNADPMTGKEQTFNGSSWSDVSGAENVSIYTYPQIALTQYQVNDVVAALKVGGYWVSLYNTPVAFDECPLG